VIKGIGIDIVCIKNISAMLDARDEESIREIFTETEINFCNNSLNALGRFATRFAAKEATMKALSLGWEKEGLDWIEIEVISDEKDKPSLNLSGKARIKAAELGVKQTWVSLSHEEDFAVALVLLEG